MCVQDPSGEAASQAQKHLTYYELDLGLNHVLRKWSEPIDNGANLLIPVPGGGDGPGGVLVAADNFIIYRDEGHEEVQRQSAAHSCFGTLLCHPYFCSGLQRQTVNSTAPIQVRAVIPRRSTLPGDRGVLIICHATHRTKRGFFFLLQVCHPLGSLACCMAKRAGWFLQSAHMCCAAGVFLSSTSSWKFEKGTDLAASRPQSEYGDLYKVTLEFEQEVVTEVRVKYFDSLPACSSICVLKTGFLFAAAEFGNHSLYQFAVSEQGFERPDALLLLLLAHHTCMQNQKDERLLWGRRALVTTMMWSPPASLPLPQRRATSRCFSTRGLSRT